jgi:uncharacterized protein
MGYPVVHFEINTRSPARLRTFYERAFDWKIGADDVDGYSPVETEGVCAGTGAPGIDGGIGVLDDGDFDFVTFYVQVPDVAAALKEIQALGGEAEGPVIEVPGGVTFAIFRDPAGNRVGLVKA